MKRRRGRSVIALALVTFVVIASLVVWRRTVGVSEARALNALRRERDDLLARRAQLERDVRDRSSRAVLAPLAERDLGMHVARAAEQRYLLRDAPTEAPAAGADAPGADAPRDGADVGTDSAAGDRAGRGT